MNQLIKILLAPLTSLIINMLGNGYFNTFVSLRMTSEGYSSFTIGILNSSYYAGIMLGSFYIERLVKQIGHIRSFAIFASINAAVIMIQSLFIEPIFWTFLRFFVGVVCGGIFIVIESWLLLLSSEKTRGKILGFYMLGLYAAQSGGQFFLNFTQIGSDLPFIITAILCTLSIVPVCMMRSGWPNLEGAEYINIFRLFQKSPMGFLGCFLSGMVLSAFYGLGPVYAKKSGMDILQVSQIMGFTILGGLALQWPIGHLSDIFERRKVLFFVSIILTVVSFLLFLGSFPFWIIILLAVLFGGLSFTLYPLSITRASDVFPHTNITAVTCGLLIVYSIGAVIGPLISSCVMEFTRPSGLFLYDTVLAILAITISAIKPKVKKPIHHEEFFPIPRTTPVASKLDPRQDNKQQEQ